MAETTEQITSITELGTVTTDPMRVFRFKATFTPNGGKALTGTYGSFSGGFSGIQGLRIDVAPIEYREGGYNTTMHKVPGMASFPPVVFTRGAMFGNDSAINWMRMLFGATSAEGLSTTSTTTFRCNIKIELMDHPNTGSANTSNVPRMAWFLNNAWISNLAYSDLNAGGNEIMFETMTIQHEGLSVAMMDTAIKASSGSAIPTWGGAVTSG